MRIVCVGGGPAGLYFSILAKLADARHEVTVFERDPPGVTYGWGVTIMDDLLDDLFRKDPESARQVWASADRWNENEVRVAGKPVAYIGGYGFSVGRHRLLDILATRATGLGVDINYVCEVDDPSRFTDADLVIACDGANSKLRRRNAVEFQTMIQMGQNKYIWLGTDRQSDKFTFAFERTSAGWIWLYAYPFTEGASTCIAECAPETWSALGFDRLDPGHTIEALEGIFHCYLDGSSLMNQTRGPAPSGWLNFKWVTNGSWHHDRVVLMGDAAHTTHFAIGLGTKLAIQDAICLAERLEQEVDVARAVREYEEERRAALRPLQQAARSSSEWFENVPAHIDQRVTQFAYSLWNRRGGRPRWHYAFHIAVQRASLRALLRWLLAARKWARSRRRTTLLRKDRLAQPALNGGR